jgi:hypothetical protein
MCANAGSTLVMVRERAWVRKVEAMEGMERRGLRLR